MTRKEKGAVGDIISNWLAGAHAIALLRATCEAGVLKRLEAPKGAKELAGELGVEAPRAERLCQALHAHGVLERVGDAYRARPEFVALESEDAPLTLSEQVMASGALQTAIASGLSPAPGWEAVSDDESLALARLAWGRPGSSAAQQMWAEVDRQMPEVTRIWEEGGSYAELGCGAGRDLLRVAVMYERVRVYGHDLKEHLLDDCRAQAEALGVAERVHLVCGDVTEQELDDAYDTIMWSQMFFPPQTRRSAMDAIARALRPSGYLLIPLMPDVPSPEDTDESAATRGLLLARVAYQRWRIHWEPEENIRRELEEHGFERVRTIDNPRTPYGLFRRG